MSEKENQEFIGKAFVSCSLREEDASFVEFVEKILKKHQIKPFGTIGRHSAAPLNIPEHMKENIPKADMVVIVATPRYLQKDLKTGKESYGLSEMVHVEAGMAYMSDKPVVVFVQEGTQVGNFLPNMTQYITLNGKFEDLKSKWSIINSLLGNAYQIAKKAKESSSGGIAKLATFALAAFGGYKLLESWFSGSEDEDQA